MAILLSCRYPITLFIDTFAAAFIISHRQRYIVGGNFKEVSWPLGGLRVVPHENGNAVRRLSFQRHVYALFRGHQRGIQWVPRTNIAFIPDFNSVSARPPA